MIFQGANLIEGGEGYVVFSKKIFVADSNEIAVSYCTGCVEVRHMENSGHRPHLLVWEPKIGKNMSFLVFCDFPLNEKSEVKFFRLKISALKRGIQRCNIHCHIMFNKGATAV
jgi:hypothetical protein